MQIYDVFNSMHNASKDYYNAASAYFKKKQDLAKMLNDQTTSDMMKSGMIDMFRKSTSGRMFIDERDKNKYRLEAAYTHFLNEFRKAAENLAEAVSEQQPDFNVNDSTFQNMLMIARIGRDLPETAARDMLLQLRTNRKQFDVVRAAMLKAGVNRDYISKIYPFDGDDMETDYEMLLEDLRGRSDEGIYSKMSKIQDRLISDAAAFGVSLDPYISDEAKDQASSYLASSSMGLKSDFEKSVQSLDNL